MEKYSLAERSRSHETEQERKERKAWLAKLRHMVDTDDFSELEAELKRQEPTNADRLAYYRSHGLTDCRDYPGGDAQFEKDVLSGEHRHASVTLEPLGREDAYIIKCIRNKRLDVADCGLYQYGVRPEVDVAIMDVTGMIRVYSSPTPYNDYAIYRNEVLSGEYAKKHCR